MGLQTDLRVSLDTGRDDRAGVAVPSPRMKKGVHMQGNMMSRLSQAFCLTTALSLGGMALTPTGAFAQTPLDPITIYEEDFEGVAALPGVLSDLNFTADTFWADNGFCNGILLDNATAQAIDGFNGCDSVPINQLGVIAAALGGGDDTNVVASSYTQGNGGPARGPLQLQSPQFALTNNHFYTASVDIGVRNCQADADPRLAFVLANGADAVSLGPEVNGCLLQTRPVQVNTIESPLAIRWTFGAMASLQLFNNEVGNAGNDSAVDNLALIDATPYLYKSFGAFTETPMTTNIVAGQPVTLTFTLVNTTDLLGKSDMGFVDTLTPGLTVFNGGSPSTSCGDGTVVVSNDGTSDIITAAGLDLATNDASCTITVEVTSQVGSFTNGPDDIDGEFFVVDATTEQTLVAVAPGPFVGRPDREIGYCEWNWNYWRVPNVFVEGSGTNYNPTLHIFEKIDTILGVDHWYDTTISPTSTQDGLAFNQSPTETTSGTDAERWYGVGRYLGEPGSTVTINIQDTGRNDGHVFAAFDSDGNQIGRYPTSAEVAAGSFYYSGRPDGNTADPEDIFVGTAWTRTFTFTVPADGELFIHYIAVDENNRITFAQPTQDICVLPELDVDKTATVASALDADGNFDVEYEIVVTNSGELTLSTLELDDDLTAADQLGGAFVSVVAEPVVSLTNTSGNSVVPTTNGAAYDGTNGLLLGTDGTLAPGDSYTVTFTVRVDADAAGAASPLDNTATATAALPNGDEVTDDSGGAAGGPGEPTVVTPPPPVLEDDESLGNEIGDTVSLNILTNDDDGAAYPVDPDTVSLIVPSGVTLAGPPTTDADGNITGFTVVGEGTWTFDPATGELEFDPEDGFLGDPTPITYTAEDTSGAAAVAPATVTIDYVDPVDPVAGDETIVSPTIEDVTFDPIADLTSDADGTVDPESVEIDVDLANFPAGTVLSPDGKSLIVPGEGEWTVDPDTGVITFSPADDLVGDPTPIGYTVRDDDGLISPTPGTLAVEYGDPPVAQDETLVSGLIEPVMFDPVADLTSDLDGTVDPESVVITSDPTAFPAGTTLSADGKTMTVPGEGVWSVDPDTGVITFTPEDGYVGDPTPITYQVTDDDGNVSNEAELAIDFGVPPTVVDTSRSDLPLGQPVTIDPLAGATDGGDGDGLDPTSVMLTLTGAPAGAFLSADGKTLTVPGEGVWTVDPDTGAITFTPEDGYEGDPTDVSFTVNDNDGNLSNEGTIDLNFQDPPVATDNSEFSATIGPVTMTPLADDTDPDGTVESAIFDPDGIPAGATLSADGLTLEVPGEGTWEFDATGNLTFTPDPALVGSPTPVSYIAIDDDGNQSNPAELIIQFGEPPVAADNSASDLPIGQPYTLDPLANDVDLDGMLDPTSVMLTLTGMPADAVLSADGKTLTVPGEGVWTVDPVTGAVTFTPEDGFIGDPTPVGYTVADDAGNVSNEATITLEFQQPPVAVDDGQSGFATNQPATINPLANDSDPDGVINPTLTVVLTTTDTPAGSVLAADGKTLTVPGEGVWTVDPVSGEVTFTPEPNFQGNPTPISYTVTDDDGNVSNEATITLEFVSEPPVAQNDSETGLEPGTAATIDPLGNDSDPDGSLDPTSVVFTGTDAPAGASLSADGKTLTVPGEGVWTIDPETGAVTFTPEDGYTDSPTPVAYTVSDTAGNVSNEAVITLTYDAPTFLSGTVFEDLDKDGAREGGEPLVEGVIVELLNDSGEVIATTTTDANGYYEFERFPFGTYTVTFTDSTSGEQIAPPLGPLSFDADNPELVDQDLPLIDELVTGDIVLTKTTTSDVVLIGEAVPYTITVSNQTAFDAVADILDIMPEGFAYVPGSALLDGIAVDPTVTGQTLTWTDVAIGPNEVISLELTTRVGPSAPVGDLTNTVRALDSVTGLALATPATATVRRLPEAVFDCSDIIGKVFDDVNMNGYQDGAYVPGSSGITDQTYDGGKFDEPAEPVSITEPGLPGVRLVTTDGTIITTDEYGRFSVPCAALPGAIGENFTLKIDENSLPTGYRVTTENPRTMRVTAGIMTEMNFGAAIGRVLDVDLTASAFMSDHRPVSELEAGVRGLLSQISDTPSIIRITYFTNGEGRDVARARLDHLEEMIRRQWSDHGTYRLIIERTVTRLQ